MEKLSQFKIIDCHHAFEGSDLKELPYLDVSECQDFSCMFKDSQIEKAFEMDTSNGRNFDRMYYNSRITIIEEINISKATSRNRMFQGSSVTVIDRVILGKNGESVFAYATNLQTIKHMDTSLCESLDSMFYGCTMLFSVPHINFASCTNAYAMFYGCTAVRTIRLANTQKLHQVSLMFTGCHMLESVERLDLTNALVIDQWGNNGGITAMFKDCSSMSYLTVNDNISYDDAKRKYRLMMTNFGLGDGRYNGRYLKAITVVTPSGTFTVER